MVLWIKMEQHSFSCYIFLELQPVEYIDQMWQIVVDIQEEL